MLYSSFFKNDFNAFLSDFNVRSIDQQNSSNLRYGTSSRDLSLLYNVYLMKQQNNSISQ